MSDSQRISPELVKRIQTLHQEHPTLGSRAIAIQLGTHKDTVLKYWESGSPVTAPSVSESNEITGDTWTVSLPKTRICTLEELVSHCKIDLSIWLVEKFQANKWEMGYKDKESNPGTIPLFQVKAFLRKKKEVVDARRELEELKALAKQFARAPMRIKHSPAPTGNMLEIDMPDLHAGKLAWGEETGGPNYDTKLAEQVFRKAFEQLLARASGYTFDEVLFIVGNDLLQSDTPEGQTYSGTPVSCDGRYQKTFRIVRTLIIECIERLREIARVKVVMISGNHDRMSVWHLGDSLECYFHKYDDVEIDNSPRNRKYHRFGKVMLMFAHGDKGKIQEYPMTMAIEEPEMFGQTKFRECHTGHKHKKMDSKIPQVDEKLGVRVRILSALCPADDWHAEEGYVGNLRSAEGFIWNRHEGLISTVIYNSPENGL